MARKVEIIGHRGARAYAPENTLEAYKEALKQGVDWIDVDVVVTRDKVLVAYHDLIVNPDILCNKTGVYLAKSKAAMLESLDRFTLNDLLIKNMSLEHLQQNYLVHLNPSSPYSKWFPDQKIIPHTHIASLQEVVDYINNASRDIAIQIEVKNDFSHPEWGYTPEELAQIMYGFIIKNNLIDRVKIQAFDWRFLVLLNELDPTIKTAYLAGHTLEQNWQVWFSDSIVMETAKNMKIKQLQSLMNLAKQLGAYSYEVEDNELTYENVRLAHKLELKVYVWPLPEHSGFVYNHELIIKLINWGVDGFITDKPGELRELLYKMGYPVPKQIVTT